MFSNILSDKTSSNNLFALQSQDSGVLVRRDRGKDWEGGGVLLDTCNGLSSGQYW